MNFIAKHPFPLGKGCFVCQKILRSRIFLFLCIRLYILEKEDRAEETHQGCFFAYGELFRRQKIPPRRENVCNLYGRETYMQAAKIKVAKSI